MFCAALLTVSVILLFLVAGILAFLIHSKIPLLTDRGNCSQLDSAIALPSKASFKSSGNI